MAKNYTLEAVTFGVAPQTVTAVGSPQLYRTSNGYQAKDIDAGNDSRVSAHRAAHGKGIIQISFNDQGTMETLNAALGQERTLVLETKLLDGSRRIGTCLNALLLNVTSDAQHAEYGMHVATFESISSDGSTNPISWAAPAP